MAFAEELVQAVAAEADLIGKGDFTTLQNRIHLARNPPAPRPGKAANGDPSTSKEPQ